MALKSPFRQIFKFVRWCIYLALISGFIMLTAVVYMWNELDVDLPSLTNAEEYQPKLASRVYSIDGRLIGEFGVERRRIVPKERIPPKLIQALLATEDKKFFDHRGIDFVGILRAVLYKVIGKSSKIGGTSTITQQVAKSLLVSTYGFKEATKRSYTRKLKEAIIATKLERNLSKEEILWIYLNHANLGHGAYGIQAAAENYFRKDVSELNLAEMTLMAGLPQAPSRYSPFINPKVARQRQTTVLKRMLRNGWIEEKEMKEALAQSVEQTVHARDDAFRDTAPYFTEHVRRYLYDTYGEKALYEGGLEVHTTLDLERQKAAEDALVNGVRWTDKRQGYPGPVAVLNDKNNLTKLLDYIEKSWVSGHRSEEGVFEK